MSKEEPRIIKVKDLLNKDRLKIPDYQRPYKWSEKNVNQLIDDIIKNKQKSAYRLGTIVIHKDENDDLNIVDGQQRTITIFLMAIAIKKIFANPKTTLDKTKVVRRNEVLRDFEPKQRFEFSNDITKRNVFKNYKTIERRLNDFDEEFISFFMHQCELVQVVISDISEAFQFFDSQNARGKDLDPQDLLKAFHLREMNHTVSENETNNLVTKWEDINPDELKDLFSNYLFRIRNWKDGKSARFFTKSQVDIFKGISPNLDEEYPYTKMYRIANYYTDEFNNSYHRKITGYSFEYPYQLDQIIINGKRFFEMVSYYEDLKNKIENKFMEAQNPIFKLLNDKDEAYDGRYRVGDRYIYNLFMCGLIYYIDRFGEYEIEKAIQKIFIWAYTLRLKLQSVGLDSVDNYAIASENSHARFNLFAKIKNAIDPNVILNMNLEILVEAQVKSTKTEGIIEKFKELNYIC